MSKVADLVNDLNFSWKMDCIYSHKLSLFEDDDVKKFCVLIPYGYFMIPNPYLQDEVQNDEDD